MSFTGKLLILELGTGTIHHENTDEKKESARHQNCHVAFQATCLQHRSGEETGVWQLFQLKHEIKKEHGPVHVDEECTMAVCIR